MSIDEQNIIADARLGASVSCNARGGPSPELKQAVAAIWINADAALRWISRETANLDEARTAIMNIIDESQRATDALFALD
jgi:hypothetical protein